MPIDPQQLAAELAALRKGRGLLDRDLSGRVGAAATRVFAIQPDDDDAVVRAKVIAKVHEFSAQIPADLREAVNVALGLDPRAQHRYLADRTLWLATKKEWNERTARRRIDTAFESLAEAALRGIVDSSHRHRDDWYVRRLKSLMRLDTPTPELCEERTITATRDGLNEIVVRFSLPRPTQDSPTAHGLTVDVQRGARIVETERPSEFHFRFVLSLPRPLMTGESHDYQIVFRLPQGQPMAPHYVFQPLTHCEHFALRVRFDLDDTPREVWLVDGVPSRILDDPLWRGDSLVLDEVGEIDLDFDAPRVGLSYGVAWRMIDS